jgi:hypothetical protein
VPEIDRKKPGQQSRLGLQTRSQKTGKPGDQTGPQFVQKVVANLVAQIAFFQEPPGRRKTVSGADFLGGDDLCIPQPCIA